MSPRLKAALLTLAAVLLWGCAPIGTRDLVGDTRDALAPVPFIGLRYGVATLCFLPFVPGALRSWSRRDLALGALCGLIGVLGYNLPAAMGNRTVSAGMVGLLNATEPLIIVLLSALRVRQFPRLMTFGAAGIGLVGILLLARAAGPAQGDPQGIALVLLAAFDWALYCVIVPPLLARHSALQVSAVTMLFGTLPMLAIGAPGLPLLVASITLPQWEILAALSFGTSVIALVAWNAGAAGLGAEAAGWFLYLLPVVSVSGGAALLAEPLTAAELLGGFLILLSVFLSQRV
jgi:drug/metabolite transporter (DMT)-like permease